MIADVVDHFLLSVPMDRVMKTLVDVASFDRYQASVGIGEAAKCVAGAASKLGLQVAVEHFPADGATRWWSFRAPIAWTPTLARLQICDGATCVLELDHALQPCALATYSVATPAGGVFARLVEIQEADDSQDLRGAVALVGRSVMGSMDVADLLVRRGAIGFLSDAPSRGVSPDAEYRGRLELASDASIFAFSLTPTQMAAARAAAGRGSYAHVTIEIDRLGTMPVVSAVLPGDDPVGEIWLTAHLCHPRPGANDNASGVAALLGVAATHVASRRLNARWKTRRTLRFIWGPEFVGLASFLHQRKFLGTAGLPSAVINLDMVGEDQARCGCPFVVERSVGIRPSLLDAVAHAVVDEVFVRTRSGGGTWRAAPFTGFSDHALFADPRLGCAAVQLCHVPDRFNHSAADTLDKVSVLEMRRATAAAAAISYLMGRDGELAGSAGTSLLRSLCATDLRTTRRLAAEYGGDWGRDLLRYMRRRNSASLAVLSGDGEWPGICKEEEVEALDTKALAGEWDGPFNTRAMLADLPSRTRDSIADAIRNDKTNLSLLFNFAIRADGQRTQQQIFRETSFALGRPLDERLANQLFAALLESGWVVEVPRGVA